MATDNGNIPRPRMTLSPSAQEAMVLARNFANNSLRDWNAYVERTITDIALTDSWGDQWRDQARRGLNLTVQRGASGLKLWIDIIEKLSEQPPFIPVLDANTPFCFDVIASANIPPQFRAWKRR